MLTWRKANLLLRTLTWRKLRNTFRIYTSFHHSRITRSNYHKGNPIKLGIEPTTFCNLRCPECPSGLRAFTRPTGMMELALYKNLIDQLAPDLLYLLLYFQGEPYLHPQFLEMAAYAHSRKIFTATSTNGHYLDSARAQATVESGLSEVIVSVDGTTQKSYESYRIGGNLEKVLEGIRNLVHWRKALKSLHPHIILQFLVVRPNEHQIPEVLALGKKLGVDKVVLKTAQVYDYAQGNPLIPTQERYSRYQRDESGRYQIKNPLENQCWKLWQGAEVTWDGKVLPCCFDKDAAHIMGTLHTHKFSDIWHSDQYAEFRHKILQSRKSIEICQNCSEGMRVWT